MTRDSVQNYVDLVNDATRATRERAYAAARGLLAQAGLEDAANDAQERIGKLADDITNASRANREMLEKLVGGEVEKAAARLGFARADEVADLRAEVDELRTLLEESAAAAVPTTAPAPPVVKKAKKSPAAAAPLDLPVKKPVAKKVAVKKAAATKSAVPTPPVTATPLDVATKKAPAKKGAAKKAPTTPGTASR